MRSSDSRGSSLASAHSVCVHGATGALHAWRPDRMVTLDRLEPALTVARENTELTKSELKTLRLLYATLMARHAPASGDDPRVMQTGAEDVSLDLHALVVINKW